MTLCYTAEGNLDEQSIRLLATNRSVVDARVVNVEPAPFDYVINTVDDLPAPSAGYHTLTSGTWYFAKGVNIGANTIRVPGGVRVYMSGQVVTANGTALEVAGTALCVTMGFRSTAGTPVTISGAAADVVLLNCPLVGVTRAILVTLGLRVVVVGGQWTVTGGLGISIGGNLPELSIESLSAVSVSGAFVQYSSGTVRSVLINGNQIDSATGINWNPAGIPTAGLLVTNNHFNMLAPNAFVAFSPATARVNCKCNTYVTGLLSETAIVP